MRAVLDWDFEKARKFFDGRVYGQDDSSPSNQPRNVIPNDIEERLPFFAGQGDFEFLKSSFETLAVHTATKYKQGDFSGEGLIRGLITIISTFTTEKPPLTCSFAYRDCKGINSGFSAICLPGLPHLWCISVVKNSTDIQKRKISIFISEGLFQRLQQGERDKQSENQIAFDRKFPVYNNPINNKLKELVDKPEVSVFEQLVDNSNAINLSALDFLSAYAFHGYISQNRPEIKLAFQGDRNFLAYGRSILNSENDKQNSIKAAKFLSGNKDNFPDLCEDVRAAKLEKTNEKVKKLKELKKFDSKKIFEKLEREKHAELIEATHALVINGGVGSINTKSMAANIDKRHQKAVQGLCKFISSLKQLSDEDSNLQVLGLLFVEEWIIKYLKKNCKLDFPDDEWSNRWIKIFSTIIKGKIFEIDGNFFLKELKELKELKIDLLKKKILSDQSLSDALKSLCSDFFTELSLSKTDNVSSLRMLFHLSQALGSLSEEPFNQQNFSKKNSDFLASLPGLDKNEKLRVAGMTLSTFLFVAAVSTLVFCALVTANIFTLGTVNIAIFCVASIAFSLVPSLFFGRQVYQEVYKEAVKGAGNCLFKGMEKLAEQKQASKHSQEKGDGEPLTESKKGNSNV